MNRQFHTQPRRDPRFSETFRDESVRMRRPPQQEYALPQPPMRDAAVILPLLLLLATEGADKYLMLALLYILM